MTHRSMSERSTPELRPAPLTAKDEQKGMVSYSQCCTTDVSKAVVCAIMFVGWCKRPIAANRKE